MELVEIVICECCMIMASNDESCDDEDSHPAGLLGLCDSHVIVASEPDLGFSFTQCDGCGTTLGGNRYTAYVEVTS